MQVTLSERASEIVRRQVAEGRYASPEEAVEALIVESDPLAGYTDDEVRSLVAEADEDFSAGDVEELTPEFFERLRQEVRAKYPR